MKAAPIEKTVRSGSLRLDIRRYADGRYGFDYHAPGEPRAKVRLQYLSDAEEKAKELIGLAEAGRVERLSIDPDEYAEFLHWKARRKIPAKVSNLVPALIDAKTGKGRTSATVRELESTLLPFAEAFPGPIGDLRRNDVERWLDARGVGSRRWNNMRAAICALHRFARADGLLPAELTPVERIERHAVTVTVGTYSADELRKILGAVPCEWLPLVVLGAFCGLRTEEISPDPRNGGWKPGLLWENVLWDKGKIDVPAAVSKVRRRRFAPLMDAAAEFLSDWKNDSGPVVPQKDHHKLTRQWFESAEVTRKDNGLRHSFASYRLAITKDAPALALEMGNSAGMIFRHYLDLKHEDEAQEWFAIRPKKEEFQGVPSATP